MENTTINELIKRAHENAVKHGFYTCGYCEGSGWDIQFIQVCSCCGGSGKLVKPNVMKDLKKEIIEFGNSTIEKDFSKDSEQSEIADIILILLAYCGEMKIDIEKAVIDKMKYNETREYRHGKNY